MKQVTKSYLQGLYDMGLNVKQMKAQIEQDYSTTLTVGRVRFMLKQAGLNLRNKPRYSEVTFVDDTVEQTTPVSVVQGLGEPVGYQVKEGFELREDAESVNINNLLSEDNGQDTDWN